MRSNYEEVDAATSLCLTTTKKGDEKIEEVDGVGDPDIWMEPQIDAMISVTDKYFIVESEETFEEWHKAYLKQYKEEYDAESNLSYDDFIELFKNGYLSVKKVIWDD